MKGKVKYWNTEARHDEIQDVFFTSWEDLRFPATGVNPLGQAGDPDVEATTGLLLFSTSTDEVIAGAAQLPHAWKEGSLIKPHVHWEKTTSAAGNVAWLLEYKWYNVGDAAPGSYTDAGIATEVVANADTANTHAIAAWTDGIVGTGKTISSMILWTLTRDVSEDNYGADARLLEFDIHYQVDATGSSTAEYIK